LAGAIQDNDRGVIIGRRSFGKGLVQEDVRLRDGSNLRLTIARYYTPSGRCIQKPYNGDIEDYYSDQMVRYDNGEMYEVDSSYFVDSLKFTTPQGRTVYGGGGIMPDVFVPADSSGSSWYLSELRMTPAFTTFAFDFVQNKRNKWSSVRQYRSSFFVTDAVLDRFVNFAKSEYGIQVRNDEIQHSKSRIKRILKGEIARQIWVEQGYYQVVNPEDNEVQKAVQLVSKP
jgi:carboxyl-terminal processing protease